MSKVVIVTGASGGIGSAIAKRFGQDGAKVVVHYNTSAQDAEDVAKEINKGPGQAFISKADVRNYKEVEGMVEATLNRWQRIDVLVNNAGGVGRSSGGYGKSVWEMDEESWDAVVDLNLKGTFLCTKAVAPKMIKQGEGHIINVGSGQGFRGSKGSCNYSAAKAGIIGFMKSVARELGDYNVKMNTVMPGLMLHKNTMGTVDEETLQRLKAENILHRHGTPEEFAETIVHLTKLQNISGQVINTDSRILF